MTPERERDLSWAAGYFDGTGGIYLKSTQVQIVVTDKDDDVLAQFHAIMSVGWVSHPERRARARTNRLAIQERGSVQEVLELLRPRMRNGRLIEAADKALAWLREREGP
jgi:hypothetical protein